MARSRKRSLVKTAKFALRRCHQNLLQTLMCESQELISQCHRDGELLPRTSRCRRGKDRLPRGGMQELRRRFPSFNLTPCLVQRIVKNYRNQEEETSVEQVDLSRKRREKCGGANLKLSVEISQKLIELNDKSLGCLSCKKLAGKLREDGFSCSKDSVRRWCQVLGAVRRRRYIKPLLSKRQRCHRLRWVIRKYKRLRNLKTAMTWPTETKSGFICFRTDRCVESSLPSKSMTRASFKARSRCHPAPKSIIYLANLE